MSSATTTRSAKRTYDSTRRAQQAAQTRADVVDAAVALFGAHGWAGTTLAAIADAAGVSVETIRNGFGSKKGLLRVAMDVAVAGDAEDIPVSSRPVFTALGEGHQAERIARAAEVVVSIHERSIGVWRAVVEAAGADPEVDAWRVELERNRRVDVVRGAVLILGEEPDDRLATLLWLLFGPETYQKLVVDESMERDAYVALLVDVMQRLAGA